MDSHEWEHGRARCIVYPPRVLGTEAAPHWRDYEYRFGGDTPEGAEILRLAEENERLENAALWHEERKADAVAAECARIRRELLEWVDANTWVGRPDDFPQGMLDKGRFLVALDRVCPLGE